MPLFPFAAMEISSRYSLVESNKRAIDCMKDGDYLNARNMLKNNLVYLQSTLPAEDVTPSWPSLPGACRSSTRPGNSDSHRDGDCARQSKVTAPQTVSLSNQVHDHIGDNTASRTAFFDRAFLLPEEVTLAPSFALPLKVLSIVLTLFNLAILYHRKALMNKPPTESLLHKSGSLYLMALDAFMQASVDTPPGNYVLICMSLHNNLSHIHEVLGDSEEASRHRVVVGRMMPSSLGEIQDQNMNEAYAFFFMNLVTNTPVGDFFQGT